MDYPVRVALNLRQISPQTPILIGGKISGDEVPKSWVPIATPSLNAITFSDLFLLKYLDRYHESF